MKGVYDTLSHTTHGLLLHLSCLRTHIKKVLKEYVIPEMTICTSIAYPVLC